SRQSRSLQLVSRTDRVPQAVRVGLLGAGNFAQSVLIPAIKGSPATELVSVCASNGARSRACAGKFGFASCTTGEDDIFADPAINTVVIATRHHLHAAQVLRAIESGKHVFCEKPLCLTEDELLSI